MCNVFQSVERMQMQGIDAPHIVVLQHAGQSGFDPRDDASSHTTESSSRTATS